MVQRSGSRISDYNPRVAPHYYPRTGRFRPESTLRVEARVGACPLSLPRLLRRLYLFGSLASGFAFLALSGNFSRGGRAVGDGGFDAFGGLLLHLSLHPLDHPFRFGDHLFIFSYILLRRGGRRWWRGLTLSRFAHLIFHP